MPPRTQRRATVLVVRMCNKLIEPNNSPLWGCLRELGIVNGHWYLLLASLCFDVALKVVRDIDTCRKLPEEGQKKREKSSSSYSQYKYRSHTHRLSHTFLLTVHLNLNPYKQDENLYMQRAPVTNITFHPSSTYIHTYIHYSHPDLHTYIHACIPPYVLTACM